MILYPPATRLAL